MKRDKIKSIINKKGNDKLARLDTFLNKLAESPQTPKAGNAPNKKRRLSRNVSYSEIDFKKAMEEAEAPSSGPALVRKKSVQFVDIQNEEEVMTGAAVRFK